MESTGRVPSLPVPGEVLVVMYHYVRDSGRTGFPALKALAVDDFVAQLDWLASACTPIGLDRFEQAAASDALPAGAALLTFDDGFVDHAETVWPLLRARGWSGVFFVSGAAVADPPRLLNVHKTQFLLARLGADRFAAEVLSAAGRDLAAGLDRRAEVYRYDQAPDVAAKHLLNYELPADEATRVLSRLFARHIGDDTAFARSLYLSQDQIRAMAAGGMTFGFHTETHPVLSRLDAASQRREVERGVDLLRDLTGQRSVPFCYPYGHPHTYNADTLAALAAAGYSAAFTTTRRLARPESDPPFEIPRYDTRDIPRADA
ncbi:MAG: hypothetical protein FJW23_02895 [Acidimicrobiia bacterium]|nr:hypothetical protein [Acidimicrobiia bacterium]